MYRQYTTYIKTRCNNYNWVIPYILEPNPHPFYSFRGLKCHMWIRIACGLYSRSWAGFWKNDRAVRTIHYNNLFFIYYLYYYIIYYIYVCMYIGFKTSFYAVRHLDSTASYLPTGLQLSFFRSWPSLIIIFIIYYSSDSPSSLITESLSVIQSLSSLSSPSSSHRMSSSDPSKALLM